MPIDERQVLIQRIQDEVLARRMSEWDNIQSLEAELKKRYDKASEEIQAKVNTLISSVERRGGSWNYSDMQKFNRYNNLFKQVNELIKELGGNTHDLIAGNLQDNYRDSYLATAYAMGQHMNISVDFNRINPRTVQEAVNYPWSGSMFSDRIWNNTSKLSFNLKQSLTQSMIQGESMGKIADRINKDIENTRFNAMRVARTETMRICYVAERHSFEDSGVVNKVEYMATVPSERTCAICGSYHEKQYDLGQEPQLPMHPQCRCTYIPVIPMSRVVDGQDVSINAISEEIRSAGSFNNWLAEVIRTHQN